MKLSALVNRIAAVRSRPVWGAWIEIFLPREMGQAPESRPVWGAWIEIRETRLSRETEDVAPRMGRVD